MTGADGPAVPDHPQDTPEEPGKHARPRPPIAPRPPSMILALVLFGVLIYIATLDYRSDGYDATYATYGLIVTIAGILGVDISGFWRGK